jgi:hypothetical protein
VPAYATLETAGSALALPEKTLKDFRSDYGGTKPLVAVHKYWEYQTVRDMPRTTLEPARMRAEAPGAVSYFGTKPVIRFIQGEKVSIPATVSRPSRWDPYAGTKPVVRALARS